MIILGNKYKFTILELERLNNKFDNIRTLAYKNIESSIVIENMKRYLNNDNFILIVLNTKVKVNNEIIKYLTNLKYDINYQALNIISIEHFLEKYLYKCYIPDSHDDLHYLDDIQPFDKTTLFLKKIIDIIAIIVLFLIFFVIKFKIKSKIKKQSPGSLYYKQLRVGLRNKEFECIKFRSMDEHDSNNDVRTATKNDDRIFSFGEIIRQTRIDEIPQVWNILKNQMSLIGPRAEWIELVKDYENKIPYYNHRHIVKTGITGWAQVMFIEGRSKDDTKQKLMYDLYYIKHWSLFLELKIIWKTIIIIFKKKGI